MREFIAPIFRWHRPKFRTCCKSDITQVSRFRVPSYTLRSTRLRGNPVFFCEGIIPCSIVFRQWMFIIKLSVSPPGSSLQHNTNRYLGCHCWLTGQGKFWAALYVVNRLVAWAMLASTHCCSLPPPLAQYLPRRCRDVPNHTLHPTILDSTSPVYSRVPAGIYTPLSSDCGSSTDAETHPMFAALLTCKYNAVQRDRLCLWGTVSPLAPCLNNVLNW